MSVLTKFQKTFNVSVKGLSQEKLVKFFAWTGNKSKVVKSDREGYIYVTDYNGRTYTVFNQVVPLIANRFVEVGQRRKSSVLEVIREVEAYPTQKTVNVPNHGKNHEWANHDTMWVRQEQFFGGGLAIPEPNSMTIVFTGFVYRLNGFHLLVNQTLDLTSYIPDEGAFYLLVQVDENGVVSYVEGDVVDSRELLEYEDIPDPESDRLELFAVKMYAGQTEIVKARTDTDVIDLRWARQNGGAGGGIETVVAGTGIDVDSSDPANPIVSVERVVYSSQTEIDFGNDLYQTSKLFTITDANIAATMKISASLAYVAPTDRDLDEVEMEAFDIKCVAGTGEFTMLVESLDGTVYGKYKINYLVI